MLIVGYVFFFFQAEDGIRDLVRSRGLGDVYKRQAHVWLVDAHAEGHRCNHHHLFGRDKVMLILRPHLRVEPCLLYTSDAADERSSVDLGGRRIIKKTKKKKKKEKKKKNKKKNTNRDCSEDSKQ